MYSSGFSPPPPMIVYPLSLRSAAIAAFCARVAAFPRRPPPAGAGTPCGALGAAGSPCGGFGAAGTPAGAFGAAGAPPGTGNLGKPPPRNGNSTPSRGPAPLPGGVGFFPHGQNQGGRLATGMTGTAAVVSGSDANQPGLGGVPVRGCFAGSQNLSSRLL